MNPVKVGHYFGADLIDFGAHRGGGLLLASGAGIMMAVMDAAPELRWALDVDTMRESMHRIPTLVVALDRNSDARFIAFVGWFSLDSPAPFEEGMRRMKRLQSLAYLADPNGGGQLPALGDFLKRLTRLSELAQSPRP